jgi:hypothetical protein
MKIEIDLDKLRTQALTLKELKESSGGDVTFTLRQWGTYSIGIDAIPDEIMIEQVRHQLESKIKEMYAYAPDVSDIEIGEIVVERDLLGRKICKGNFYYGSPIFDHWYGEIRTAEQQAANKAKSETWWELAREMFNACKDEDKSNCSHTFVLNLLKEKLNLEDDYDWEWMFD